MGNIYRDTTLNNVSEQDIGKELKVAGWVENIRDHGGVSFIDLRDMYAVLQVVIRDPELLKGIKKEECISIEGVVEKEMKKHTIRRFRQEQSNSKQRRLQCSDRFTQLFLLKL